MQVLFLADIEENTGPSNANRAFCEHWPKEDDIITLRCGGKISKLISAVVGALKCDIAITSGPNKVYKIIEPILRIRKKPICAYCHGYAPYENEVEHLNLNQRVLDDYMEWIESSAVVITNSMIQKKLIEQRHPNILINVVNLGVDPFKRKQATSKRMTAGKLTVSVSGGTRFCKGNEVVAEAVDILVRRGYRIEFRVYGRRYAENSDLDDRIKNNGRYCGQVDRRLFLEGLSESDVFVMNSRHESFGLSAIDALSAGCSLLISRNCGVTEILKLNDHDLICDTENAGEIASKIEELFFAPNGTRIIESIDFKNTSWESAAQRLRNVCFGVAEMWRRGKAL